MESKKIRAVFFDCWSTVISFSEKRKDWNTAPLKRHALDYDRIDWASVDQTADSFFSRYYQTTKYEIKYNQFLQCMMNLYSIRLDCDMEFLNREVLDGLDPKPIQGIGNFLSYLERHNIYHAILSNTIYEDEDSMNVINRLIPSNHFSYFFGSGNVGVKKPDPLFFQAASRPSGIPLSDSMYIGDTFYQDVFGSNQAGFAKSVWLNTRNKDKSVYSSLCDVDSVDYVEVKDYDELLAKFGKGIFGYDIE